MTDFFLNDATSYDQSSCFALLDDASHQSQHISCCRLYTGFSHTVRCKTLDQFSTCLQQMETALQDGLWGVALFSYELGAHMQGVDGVSMSPWPMAEILFFKTCQHLTSEAVTTWLSAQRDDTIPTGITQVHCDATQAEFVAAVTQIHAYLVAGDAYQVNLTTRLRADVYGDPLALYARLRCIQPVPYGAFIRLEDGRTVISLSPELFVRFYQGKLTAQPMKGTCTTSTDPFRNQQLASQLAKDPKNRAENLMIVDLLRNDLGKIGVPGTIQVTSLFDVQQFHHVWQMTSTVIADITQTVTLPDILAAIHPCGSITGAPKKRAMEIIQNLESSPRGLYTGAIGWFDPPTKENMGDFCLSVVIRTLCLAPPEAANSNVRCAEMGVGAGIVVDSQADDEYAEVLLKARFLMDCRPEFSLFETIRVISTGCLYLDQHFQRLRQSAYYFGFVFNLKTEDALRTAITTHLHHALLLPPYRLRVTLHADGTFNLQSTPITQISSPVNLLISSQTTNKRDIFLRHKTTFRKIYNESLMILDNMNAFDMLFFNSDGELTEGARSNVFIQHEGHWYTPPIDCGLLPGVMRDVLLHDPQWSIYERRLYQQDLLTADKIFVCNALRGILAAAILAPDIRPI